MNKLWLIFSSVALVTALMMGLSVHDKGEKVQFAEEERSTVIRDHLPEKFNDIREQMTSLPDFRSAVTIRNWHNAQESAKAMHEDSEGAFKKEWGVFLASEANNRDIDPFIVYELLRVETGGKFDPEMTGPETSYGHAYGLAQFMTNTAPWIADMAGVEYDEDLLFDPYYSMLLSVEYLDFLYDRYDNWNYALTAYHRGIYGMENYVSENGHAKSWYAVEIQKMADDTGSLVSVNQ